MKERIDLQARSAEVQALAAGWFRLMTSISPDIRQDIKPRTGIATCLWEKQVDDMDYFTVEQPSVRARILAVEKLVRTKGAGDYSSANTAIESQQKYPGCVAIPMSKQTIYVSVSGLKSEEDVALSVLILAYLFKISPRYVCKIIRQNHGILPVEFDDPNHYLYKFVDCWAVYSLLGFYHFFDIPGNNPE